MYDISSRTIKLDGRDVHYYTAGEGEPLVAIHGGGGDARTWRRNIGELAGKYTVYAPDLPGYGGSQPLDGKYYIPELSEFLEKFTGKLGLDKFNLLGHSLGGGVALNFALNFPARIKKLVLVSSLCLGNEIAGWVRFFSLPAFINSIGAIFVFGFKSIKWLLNHLDPMRYILPLSPASMFIGGAISRAFRQQTLVMDNQLNEVKVPTLVVWGGRDPVVPVKHAYRAAKMIPDCQIAVFKKSGHNVHREQLKNFSRVVTDFLG
jgi:pimeloyl-ACP methyl ester carboxylesterase